MRDNVDTKKGGHVPDYLGFVVPTMRAQTAPTDTSESTTSRRLQPT